MDETGPSAAPMAYAELSGAEIRTTIQKLHERIVARFPGSGLSRISVDRLASRCSRAS